MAEFELPGFDQAVKDFDKKMREHMANLDDMDKAIKSGVKSGATADEMVDDAEARRLMRTLPEDADEQ